MIAAPRNVRIFNALEYSFSYKDLCVDLASARRQASDGIRLTRAFNCISLRVLVWVIAERFVVKLRIPALASLCDYNAVSVRWQVDFRQCIG